MGGSALVRRHHTCMHLAGGTLRWLQPGAQQLGGHPPIPPPCPASAVGDCLLQGCCWWAGAGAGAGVAALWGKCHHSVSTAAPAVTSGLAHALDCRELSEETLPFAWLSEAKCRLQCAPQHSLAHLESKKERKERRRVLCWASQLEPCCTKNQSGVCEPYERCHVRHGLLCTLLL